MASQVLRQIPSTSSIREIEHQLQQYDPWFYPFEFENGATTVVHSAAVADIHRTRADIILPFVDHYFRDRWSQVRCLDVACHQGWFATQIALRGPKSVEGVDIRAEHIAQANLIRDLGDLRHLSFREADIYQLGAPPCELTLCLGLLYHLENPLGALRCMRTLTSELCIVETQVAKAEGELQCLWGSGLPRKGPGIAVVPADPVAYRRAIRCGAGANPACVIRYAVCGRVLATIYGGPPRTVHEQFQYPGFERVVVFAQVAD